ncbi:hypothetical protein H9I45_01630 [Polaribacter haliotis]|uniref:Uncharacterized protein n=1 Tax=Polaribacter haliotis TaxID=1888915 RepID=A0A7L8AGR7_9FLAO|nr:hypothetical protein [Polaribacter haliotis]QOD61172.1 hypothetical protein H9I45_01630 [Polaribacter haliotis]
MLPVTIEVLHDLEEHEHTVCTSIGEQHLHKQDLDCDQFHKQLTVFSSEIASNYDVIPPHFYKTTFIDKPQITSEVYHSKKWSRGPPNFTI